MNLGSKKISALFIGSNEANKAYIGSHLVWKKLPYDAEVEYLASNGSQYINTGVFPTNAIEAECDAEITGYKQYANVFGSYGGGGSFLIQINNRQSMHFAAFNGDALYNTAAYTITFLNIRHVYRLANANGVTQCGVDGTTVKTYNAQLSTLSRLIGLFGRSDATSSRIAARIYNFKLSIGGNTVIDFIPVRVGSIGYMYDKISGQLFGNQGTGSFSYGPDKT